MTIAQRLLLAVLPAIVGLLTVAGLAYWGNMYRAAPEWVVVAAAVAALGSLFLAWRNTRYVARRIERLAGRGTRRLGPNQSPLAVVRDAAHPGVSAAPDEIDSIEDEVDRLSSAMSLAEAGSREREAAAAQRIQEYASRCWPRRRPPSRDSSTRCACRSTSCSRTTSAPSTRTRRRCSRPPRRPPKSATWSSAGCGRSRSSIGVRWPSARAGADQRAAPGLQAAAGGRRRARRRDGHARRARGCPVWPATGCGCRKPSSCCSDIWCGTRRRARGS